MERDRLRPDEELDEGLEDPCELPGVPVDVPYALPVDDPEAPVDVPAEPPVLGRVADALPEPIAVPPSVVLVEPVAPVAGVVWGGVPRGCCCGLSG